MQHNQRDSEQAGPRPAPPHPIADALWQIRRSTARIGRLEQLRTEYQDSMIRRETRRAAAEILEHDRQLVEEASSEMREDREVDQWVCQEADGMLRAGWTAEQLAELGFHPRLIADALRRRAGA